MITGYNTDVECDGVVYHVQTEDKGVETPVIVSLVYEDGAILASKRSPYDDLIAAGFDESILTQRLQRQHKLICAAVHAGRIEDLKRLGERDVSEKTPSRQQPAATAPIPTTSESSEPDSAIIAGADDKSEVVRLAKDRFSISGSAEVGEALQLRLLEEVDLRAGESVTVRVLLTRGLRDERTPVQKTKVVFKVLGSSFHATSTISKTDSDGVALLFASLPKFTTGRAAILIRAEVEGEIAELRRIILPAESP